MIAKIFNWNITVANWFISYTTAAEAKHASSACSTWPATSIGLHFWPKKKKEMFSIFVWLACFWRDIFLHNICLGARWLFTFQSKYCNNNKCCLSLTLTHSPSPPATASVLCVCDRATRRMSNFANGNDAHPTRLEDRLTLQATACATVPVLQTAVFQAASSGVCLCVCVCA